MTSLSDHHDHKRSGTAPRQFLSGKIQPRIKRSDFEHISTRNLLRPTVLHEPAPKNHCLQQENYRKKNKIQQPPPVQAPGGSKTPTA
jgi:hypothetical protein